MEAARHGRGARDQRQDAVFETKLADGVEHPRGLSVPTAASENQTEVAERKHHRLRVMGASGDFCVPCGNRDRLGRCPARYSVSVE